MVKLSSGKNWLKSSDLKTGDKLGIINEGEWTESSKFTYDDGSPVKQFVIRVSLHDEQRDITLNKVSRTNLADGWGDETAKWVGKVANVEKVKVMVGGKMLDSVVLHATGGTEPVSEPAEDFSTAGEEENVPF